MQKNSTSGVLRILTKVQTETRAISCKNLGVILD